MDRLSVDVWLRIFTYLHTTDILYSFSNLNNQLEELIMPYQHDINFSDISFQSLKQFVQHVLPYCKDNIHSFTIKNNYQIEFCIRNNLFRPLLNLQCLRLQTDFGKKMVLTPNFFSNHFKYLTKLTKLDLYNVSIYVNDFAAYMPLSLTHLNLGYVNESLTVIGIERLRNLKVLKTYLRDLNELCLIESLHHLRELYICLLEPGDFNDFQNLKFSLPKSFVKLHLECRELTTGKTHSSWKILATLLSTFRKRLQSLTLIIDSITKEYADFDQLEHLKKCFSRLTSFQYLIHTPYRPSEGFDQIKNLPDHTYFIYTMKPRRPINYFELFKYDFFESMSTPQRPRETLYFARTFDSRNLTVIFPSENMTIGHKLPNIRHFSHSMLMRPNIDDLVRLFLWSATNLNFIKLIGESPKEILQFLKYLPNSRKKIDYFQCNCSTPLNSAFFFALSRNLPSLKYLYLINTGFFEKSINNNDRQTSSKSLIDSIQKYLKNVILIEFSINVHDRYTMQKTNEYKNAILWLNQHSDSLFYADYVIDKQIETHLISVWL